MNTNQPKSKQDDNHDNENPSENNSEMAFQCGLSNGYHYDNGYHALSSPQKRGSNISDDEIKDAYFKIRETGIKPTAKLLRTSIGRGSYSTLQKGVSKWDRLISENAIEEIKKLRAPDSIIQQLSVELAKSALKHTIESDDMQIQSLTQKIYSLMDLHEKSDAIMAADIDAAESKISEQTLEIAGKDERIQHLLKENQALSNQVGILSTEINQLKSKYKMPDGIDNLLKVLKETPDSVKELYQKLEENSKKVKER